MTQLPHPAFDPPDLPLRTKEGISSAWHCTSCARLHLYAVPGPKPDRCEDCLGVDIRDAGPSSGFGALDVGEAEPRIASTPTDRKTIGSDGKAFAAGSAARVVAEARRLCAEARIASESFRTALAETSATCASSRRARARRSGAQSGFSIRIR
jgi:hypothetical protein